MTVKEIEVGIQKAWDLIISPIAVITVSSAALLIIAPSASNETIELFSSLRSNILVDQHTRALLDFYGISKLLPIISVIVMIAILSFLQKIVLFVGNQLPGHVIISSPYDYLAVLDASRVLVLWRHFPGVSDVGELIRAVHGKLYALPLDVRRSILYWEREEARWHRILFMSKFVLVYSMMILIIESFFVNNGNPQFLNFILVCLFTIGTAILSVFRILLAHEQVVSSKIDGVETTLAQGELKVTGSDTESVNIRTASINSWKQNAGWWQIVWFNLPGSDQIGRLLSGRRASLKK